jgi:hypothetical protein
MDAVAHVARSTNASIHAPKFGSGLAGGYWPDIEDMIVRQWIKKDISVTIYSL